MSAPRSANSVAEVVRLRSELSRVRQPRAVITLPWLSVGLLGLLMAGCQTASLRSTVERPIPTPRISESTASKTVSGKTLAAGLATKNDSRSPVASAIPLKSRVSLQLVNWQSEEPPPLVGGESPQSSDAPLAETLPESNCDEICFRCDLQNALPTLWCDTKAVVNWNNALILTAAGGLAIGFRESDIDQRVRDSVADHPQRWGDGTRILGNIGDIAYQAPVILGVYGYSVWRQDEELHDLMGSIISASAITGVSTSALKLITNTERPSDKWNDGQYGFPSYHTASTFAIAAVLDEYYGCQVGLPAYALATAVGFSRIDDQDHDLSDVVFGAALGYVIGRTVASRHLCDESNLQLGPYVHPTDGTPGIAIEAKF